MKTLLTCVLLLAFNCASAQKGTISWNDLERLTAMDLAAFEKEMERMGFSPDTKSNKNTTECATLGYLGEVTANGDRNKAATTRCSDGMRTVSYYTTSEADITKMKDAATASGFKLKPGPGTASDAGAYTRDGKQMRTDRSVANGVSYYTISYSGSWPLK